MDKNSLEQNLENKMTINNKTKAKHKRFILSLFPIFCCLLFKYKKFIYWNN